MHTFYIYLYMVFIYTRLLFYMHYIADYIIFGHNKKKMRCFLSLESSFCLDVCLRVDTLSDYIGTFTAAQFSWLVCTVQFLDKPCELGL